ncbi:MAG: hypothetical protein M3292_00360 [Actinomycetota bacterium]|nr:hypothetical protein [Actinomycetota bacterium]
MLSALIQSAARFSGHRRLDNLVLLVDNNHMQADGATEDVMNVEPVPEKLQAFGFAARRIDAHSITEILTAFSDARATLGHPTARVCETLPGKGVPSLELNSKVHYIRGPSVLWERALAELG